MSIKIRATFAGVSLSSLPKERNRRFVEGKSTFNFLHHSYVTFSNRQDTLAVFRKNSHNRIKCENHLSTVHMRRTGARWTNLTNPRCTNFFKIVLLRRNQVAVKFDLSCVVSLKQRNVHRFRLKTSRCTSICRDTQRKICSRLVAFLLGSPATCSPMIACATVTTRPVRDELISCGPVVREAKPSQRSGASRGKQHLSRPR